MANGTCVCCICVGAMVSKGTKKVFSSEKKKRGTRRKKNEELKTGSLDPLDGINVFEA